MKSIDDFNVQIVKIDGEDVFGIRILDENYLNLVYKYDNLHIEGELLQFEINVLDNPNNISDEILNSVEFSDFVGQYILQCLTSQMEKESIDDDGEGNTKELS